jgi:hypothetical protein
MKIIPRFLLVFSLLFAVIAALLISGCAVAPQSQSNSTAAYQEFERKYEVAFGKPQSEWTLEERTMFLDALEKFHQARLAQIDAPRRQPIIFPVIQPPVFPMPQYQHPTTTQIKPDGNGGYTAWSDNGTTQNIEPDGRGGYTMWGSDGRTHQLVPDGQGGWTQY